MLNNKHLGKILDRPEIENIKNDFRSIKSNGAVLAKDLKHDGRVMVRDSLDQWKTTGSAKLHRAEDSMRGVSGKTLAAGLVAGLVLGYFCKK